MSLPRNRKKKVKECFFFFFCTVNYTSGKGVLAFNRASGGERPARAALALVLDGSNNTLSSPVNLCDSFSLYSNKRIAGTYTAGQADFGEDSNSAVVSGLHYITVVHAPEFLNWHIGKLVQFN